MTITEQQRQERKNYIGGSDMSIILGLSSYKTAYELYLEKKGLIESKQEETQFQYWGNRLESILRDEFSRRNAVIVEEPTETYVHPLYSFLRGNLDGLIPEKNYPWDGKSSNQFMSKEWGETGSDKIPLSYLIQIAHYCSVMNADLGYLSVLIGGNDYREFTYRRDLELEEHIIEAAYNFWNSVERGVPPTPINIEDLKLKYPYAEPGKSKRVNFEIIKNVDSLLEIKSKIKELEVLEEKEKFSILQYMENHEYLLDEHGGIICSWKTNKKGSRSFLVK